MRVLVVCLADVSSSPRPNRILNYLLSRRHVVDLAAYSTSSFEDINNLYIIGRSERSTLYKLMYGSCFFLLSILSYFNIPKIETFHCFYSRHLNLVSMIEAFALYDFDYVLVENLELLPSVLCIKKRAKVIFDAREYYPKEFENSLVFRYLYQPFRMLLCNRCLPKVDYVLTVSPGLATAYYKTFGIQSFVLRNTSYYFPAEPRPTDPCLYRMVHHGIANSDRSIADMIRIVKVLDDRFTLDLYLTGKMSSISELAHLASDCDRIRVLPPVSYENIIPMLCDYDIGFYYLKPNGFNVTHSLPNKLFEFIQARLAVAIGPSPDMASVVVSSKVGFVSKSFAFKDVVYMLSSLTVEEIDKAKLAAHKASRHLCFEKESSKLANLIPYI